VTKVNNKGYASIAGKDLSNVYPGVFLGSKGAEPTMGCRNVIIIMIIIIIITFGDRTECCGLDWSGSG
jgi:hypothetical protein